MIKKLKQLIKEEKRVSRRRRRERIGRIGKKNIASDQSPEKQSPGKQSEVQEMEKEYKGAIVGQFTVSIYVLKIPEVQLPLKKVGNKERGGFDQMKVLEEASDGAFGLDNLNGLANDKLKKS
ncbi:hypothetical protein L6452_26856 [Arctium lappa]|uniref:Uncharacterized protein n=1 Tax=Arctium lappa TaxID=4217 RepID=A0ACB8ZWB6_ARCLA|nr:hypothetical protein L6452_26856 [Arctium lappa]